ncbi:hypothetical protein GCM10010358_56360 [Streptomyces minutiscleroticus]|uniref:Uncharacterized protein n=1 Tax=Streptomyces minutiscleroticus TaxID=68238 RepID=A0A918NTY6_9ACTN|nr:hypothetical protein GCM10010358_56360 [Streptomyces minutiscleroticus]
MSSAGAVVVGLSMSDEGHASALGVLLCLLAGAAVSRPRPCGRGAAAPVPPGRARPRAEYEAVVRPDRTDRRFGGQAVGRFGGRGGRSAGRA